MSIIQQSDFSHMLKKIEDHKEKSESRIKICYEEYTDEIMNEEYLKNVYFYRCNFYNCDFKHTSFSRTVFKECSFEYCNFTDCDIKGTRFLESHLKRVKLEKCNTMSMGLEYSTLESLTIDLCEAIDLDITGSTLDNITHPFERMLTINGLEYPISIVGDMVRVGCQRHSYKKWKDFEPESIEKMAENAWNFYPTLLNLLEGIFKPVYKGVR